MQLTPPGSGCSIIFGEGLTSAQPGSFEGLQLSCYDIDAARADARRGAGSTSASRSTTRPGSSTTPGPRDASAGAAPGRADYGSFVSFSDPDGNGWLLQEIKTRLPGR